jgi:hypothetical protein
VFRDSEEICKEFPNLPVQYIRQDPPIPALHHFNCLARLVNTDYIATLHDDDWWLPRHLECAIEALEKTAAVASFSNFLESYSPQHPRKSSYKALRVWAATGQDFSKKCIRLSSIQNFLIHFLSTSIHYSTYVGRAAECSIATQQLVEIGNDFDNDRNFPILLGECGQLLYLTDFGACIRIHGAQDCARSVFVDGSQRYALNTAKLAIAYPELTKNAIQLYNNQVRPALSDKDLQDLENSISYFQKHALANHGLMIAVPNTDPGTLINRKRNKVLSALRRVFIRLFQRSSF